MKFEENLKKLRSLRGISQATLAEALNVSTGLIGMYEAGKRKPSYEMLETIADYFNVSIDYLTGKESSSLYYLAPEDILNDQERDFVAEYRKMPAANRELVLQMMKELNKNVD